MEPEKQEAAEAHPLEVSAAQELRTGAAQLEQGTAAAQELVQLRLNGLLQHRSWCQPDSCLRTRSRWWAVSVQDTKVAGSQT